MEQLATLGPLGILHNLMNGLVDEHPIVEGKGNESILAVNIDRSTV
jgi:hypothetical protein